MPHIILTDEQARIIEQAQGAVELRDPGGNPVATVVALSEVDREMIARSRRSRSAGGAPVPGASVREHFRRLAEIAEQRDLTEELALDLLRRMRAGEEV